MLDTWSVDWPKDWAPSVCGLGNLYGFRVRVNWLLRFQWILGNWLLLVETSHILSRWKKPGLTLVYHLSLEWGSRLWNYTMWGQALRTPFLFSAYSEYLAESGTWLNGLWQDGVLSWSHHPHAVCPGARHLHSPYLSTETSLHELFERITSRYYKMLHIFCQRCPFCTKLFSPKDSSTHISSLPL